ncbi:MAG: hypothetical protein K0R08_1944, partial [Solimicrobium sp.]|nr:hypothetical protein [Solimicrobium sp.]
ILRNDRFLQNILILLDNEYEVWGKWDIDFFTGNARVCNCFHHLAGWKRSVLERSHIDPKIPQRIVGSGYLDSNIANIISNILSRGVFEPIEKTTSKLIYLLKAAKNDRAILDLKGLYLQGINFHKADLRRADLRETHLEAESSEGADFRGAKSDNPKILCLIAEQENIEKFTLLLEAQQSMGSVFNGDTFPRELIWGIGKRL